MIVAGVDEAGRGCVFGPLVVCAYSCEGDLQAELARLGVRDSKEIPPGKRGRMLEVVEGRGDFVFDVLTAEYITDMMRRKVSLNDIEAISVAGLLGQLHAKAGFSRAYVDSPDPVPAKFEARIRKHAKLDFDIVSRNKADRDFPVVGAASIVAKVMRERELDAIKRLMAERGLEGDIGSGYSHDAAAVAFLEAHWKSPALNPYVRWEWATAKNVQAHQVDLGGFL